MQYDYLNTMESDEVYGTVGSFSSSKHSDFKENVKYVFESVKMREYDPIKDLPHILRNDKLKSEYKNMLLGDVMEDCARIDVEGNYNVLSEKLEQLFENSAFEILSENYMSENPLVGLALPILKKSFIQGHSKDIVMTEVPKQPIIKAAFERQFMKDREGRKYYIPDVFYDNQYKTIMAKSKGNPISSAFYPTGGGTLPINDLNLLEESGGSLARRDQIALDFCIAEVIMKCDQKNVTIPVNIIPITGNNDNVLNHVVEYTDPTTGVKYSDRLFGHIDFYAGIVSVSSSASLITKVRFGGHLSNENNDNTIELDSERQLLTWMIPDGERINTGLTIEKIKDHKALFDVDITAQMISSMSEVLAQSEDSNILNFLIDSFDSWSIRSKDMIPFGYTEGFTETQTFNCEVPSNTYTVQSEYIETELKFNLNRFIDKLKVKLKNTNLMFVLYGHPNNISLLNARVDWKLTDRSQVGGVQLDYSYGVITENGNTIRVLSTLKCPMNRGLRVVAIATSNDRITFKHFKYSLNIENSYRNPLTPNIPNVMMTTRYKTIEVEPVQGEFRLKNSDFGNHVVNRPVAVQVDTPKISLAPGEYTGVQTVTLSSNTPNAIFHYTLDGSDPIVGISPIFDAGITIASSATLKVVAVAKDMIMSEKVEATYTIK